MDRHGFGLMGVLLAVGGCYGSPTLYTGGPVAYEAAPDRHPQAQVAFRDHGTNPREDTRDTTTSTFGLEVDDASFVYARGELEAGRLPEPDMVRVEEFVNHLDYGDPAPREGPIALRAELAPSPFEARDHLLRLSLQAADAAPADARPRRLVFAIDASGSMAGEQRMSLVKYCVLHLVERLRSTDRVAIVAFAEKPRVVLWETPASDRDAIWRAVGAIVPRGPTDVVAGLAEAYALAGPGHDGAVETRVVLCSDGLANRATIDGDALLARIADEARAGVRLTAVGFGADAYNDAHLERLAREGQGRYTHVRAQADIEREFGGAFLRSLHVVAEDVRVQVRFDPAVVRSWRLLGYESRHLANPAFESRHVRAAHLEAGRGVTAIYELRLHDGARGVPGVFEVAWRDPWTGRAQRASATSPGVEEGPAGFAQATAELRLAACTAELAELLRGSVYARERTYAPLIERLEELQRLWLPSYGAPPWAGFHEVLSMARTAQRLDSTRRHG